MASINPLSSPSLIGSATSQGRGRNSQNQQLPASGQPLKALVVEAQEGGRFTLDIGGNRLTASSTTPLSPGQSLQLQIVKTEPLIELKIVDGTLTPFVGRSLNLLGKSIDLSSIFQAARQLNPIALELLTSVSRNVLESFFALQQHHLDAKDGGVVLKQLIDQLGLNLEHLLARGDKNGAIHTLKAALLEMANKFSSPETISESAGKLITTLELFQLTQLHLGSDTNYIFPLPLPFIEQGYLAIERDGRSESKSNSMENRCSLHLTMSDLGNLRIDILQNGEGLFIRFSADSKQKADFLAAFGEELHASLASAPFVGLTFCAGAPDPINDLIRKLVPEGKSMLDMKV